MKILRKRVGNWLEIEVIDITEADIKKVEEYLSPLTQLELGNEFRRIYGR